MLTAVILISAMSDMTKCTRETAADTIVSPESYPIMGSCFIGGRDFAAEVAHRRDFGPKRSDQNRLRARFSRAAKRTGRLIEKVMQQ
jgi:hypothetical protein